MRNGRRVGEEFNDRLSRPSPASLHYSSIHPPADLRSFAVETKLSPRFSYRPTSMQRSRFSISCCWSPHSLYPYQFLNRQHQARVVTRIRLLIVLFVLDLARYPGPPDAQLICSRAFIVYIGPILLRARTSLATQRTKCSKARHGTQAETDADPSCWTVEREVDRVSLRGMS